MLASKSNTVHLHFSNMFSVRCSLRVSDLATEMALETD